MSTRAWTNPANGRTFITVHGEQIRIDALPPNDYTPTTTAPGGPAMLPCRICRRPLDIALALRGAHLGCLPEHLAYGRLRICGGIFTTLTPVYRGERTGYHGPNAPRELPSTGSRHLSGGAAA